jgi:hypothetical protein
MLRQAQHERKSQMISIRHHFTLSLSKGKRWFWATAPINCKLQKTKLEPKEEKKDLLAKKVAYPLFAVYPFILCLIL